MYQRKIGGRQVGAIGLGCMNLSHAYGHPPARGFLSGGVEGIDAMAEKDIRRVMPRFQEPNYSANRALFGSFRQLAGEACTPGQLALNWLLAQGDNILPIPGSRSVDHLEENVEAAEINIDPTILAMAGELINQSSVAGERYPPATQAEIDTEEF